jgi:thiamine pyrophosphate-dependent acetolactate synthase large subunit-like protein
MILIRESDQALASRQKGNFRLAIPPPAAEAALSRAGNLIAGARRPIAVIGAAAIRFRDPDVLRRVIERHRLPFATTTMAKGMVDEDHPLAIGCIERACRIAEGDPGWGDSAAVLLYRRHPHPGR